MHKLTDVNVETRTAVCSECGDVAIQSGGKRQGWRCQVKARQLRKNQKQYNVPHRNILYQLVDPHCSRCEFRPSKLCQLDVHHKDHNHKNNDPKNLEILCANCHRLEHCC